MDQAYRLCVGMFKQKTTGGSAYAKLPSPHNALTWDFASIIPTGYDFTNFNLGDTAIETVEKNTITQLTKTKEFSSGAVTPPVWSFNKLSKFEAGDIVSVLDALTEDDPFKVLVCAGYFASESTGSGVTTRTYTVSKAAVGILTADGGLNAEAKQNFTGTLSLQCCHLPLLKATDCAATLSWNTSTGAITLVPNVGTGS